MKIEAKIRYEEEYLPTKRHRIARIREIEESVLLELREIKKESAPIAMVVTDYKSFIDENGQNQFGLRDSLYVAIENQLYSEKRDMQGSLDKGSYSMEEFMEAITREGDCRRSWCGKSREDILRSLDKFMNSHVLIDGVIYEQKGEPRYVINTFGLGHNHGGTGMFIEDHYNPNINKSNYFTALQRDEAIAYANKVAEARGDTKNVGTFGVKNIKVYMSEMIRCNPNSEHGNGNPLLNAMEDLVQVSSSSLEAGMFVMAAASNQLSGNKTSLSDQIQSASSRAAESHSSDKATVKETTPER